jgi:uncharacterized protein YjbJ (UPF0337 family)
MEHEANTETDMDWDLIERTWKQNIGHVKAQWAKLSDSQLDEIDGKRARLAQEIQKTYGISEHAAEWQLSGWHARMQQTLQ